MRIYTIKTLVKYEKKLTPYSKFEQEDRDSILELFKTLIGLPFMLIVMFIVPVTCTTYQYFGNSKTLSELFKIDPLGTSFAIIMFSSPILITLYFYIKYCTLIHKINQDRIRIKKFKDSKRSAMIPCMGD